MTVRYACVRGGAIIAGPGPWRNFAFWTDPDTGDIMQWTAKSEAERAALGWREVRQDNAPSDPSAVKNQTVLVSVDAAGAPIETWSWEPQTDAERAAALTLRAPDFYDVLLPLLEAKGFTPTAPLRAWLITYVSAIADADLAVSLGVSEEVAGALKIAVINRTDAASEFDRADSRLDQFAALFGVSSAEIDQLFLGGAGA